MRENSLTLIFAALLLLAASLVQADTWRRCGNVRTAIRHSSQYHIAGSENTETAYRTAFSGAEVQLMAATGDVYCKCLSNDISPLETIDITVPLQSLRGEEHINVTVTFTDPCRSSVCQYGAATGSSNLLRLPEEVLTVELRQPSCAAMKMDTLRVGGNVAVKMSRAIANNGRCEEYGKLLINSVFHFRHHAPALFVRQELPFHIGSCRSGETQLVAMQQLNNSPPPTSHYRQSRVKRQLNHVPTFERLYYNVSILENSPQGTLVTTIIANDSDVGTNGQLTYTMSSVDIHSELLFNLNPNTGIVTTAGDIDREEQHQHDFLVTATDGGGLDISAFYIIRITDENDNSPTFQDSSHFLFHIPEDHQPSTQACDTCSITVIDEDDGNNGLVSYQLLNNTGEAFTIVASGNQATLTVVRELDHETLDYYLLTLLAMDDGTPPHTTSATIEIFIWDIADNPPQFNASSYSLDVLEDTPTGTYLMTIHATSLDSAPLANIEYYITGGDVNMNFQLNPTTGVLTLLTSLDFEATERYSLTVQAQSGPHGSLKTHTSVTVDVLNVNDHVPTYGRSQYTVSVPETVDIGHHVIGVNAEDLDDGEFGVVTYRIDESSANLSIIETFSLHPTSGSITTLVSLDRESREEYSFTVFAEDGGDPPLTGEVRVVVRVSDINDEAPVFTQSSYSASISEDASTTASVVQVEAVDSDSATVQLEYIIHSGNVQNRFYLDGVSGLITTHTPLDREHTASYTLIVRASDGQQETSVPVYITVTDVNDQSPIFPTTFYVKPDLSELLEVNTEVLRVQAIDNDEGNNSRVVYSVFGAMHPEFHLDPAMGIITLSQTLDYEDTEYYTFTVMATDMGNPPRSSTARVEITIRDENDNAPTFTTNPLMGTVTENAREHTSVLQLQATDQDSGSNAVLTFEIIGDFRAIQAFSIDASGVIYTTQPLDREIQEVYSLRIQVTDNGQEPLSATTTVDVVIADEIDYPPVFSQVTYEYLVSSPVPQDTVLVEVSAITRDAEDSILYAITSGANHALFKIDQTTGIISAATMLDPVAHSGVYSLQVTAQHKHLSERVPVIITIMLDDGIPKLGALVIYYSILHSQLPEGEMALGTVQIVQRKEELSYVFSLQPSGPLVHRYFTIGSALGNISVTSGVRAGYYPLNVSVSTSTGTGYGLVEVYVSVLTNDTLENTVVAIFGDAGEIDFASIQLERFAEFLEDILSCSREQIEIFGIQQEGAFSTNMVQVAFSVKESGLHEYIPPETILDRLFANRQLARPPTLLEYGSEVCVSEPCPNLQQCRPVLELFRYRGPDMPLKVLKSTERVYFSHPFSQSYTCVCPKGFSPEALCSTEINECETSPCHFEAPCHDLVDDYICDCPESTLGKNCSIVCPSLSCQPCTPNPCLYGGVCNSELASYTCTSCPWGASSAGPNCELTSLHFMPGGYAAFSPLGASLRMSLSFSFATVTPSGLLLYNGRVSGSHDYITVELVIGQLAVGVSLGGGGVKLKTESIWQLNDGEWHEVNIQLDNQVLTVVVSGCSKDSLYLDGVMESCLITTTLPSGRTLDLNGPLYLGGVENYVTNLPLSSTTYHGCLSSLSRDGSLVDLSSALRSFGTREGCPPLEVTCDQVTCDRGECVRVWNGSLCSCDGDMPLCADGDPSVQLWSGYLHLSEEGSETTLEDFALAFRTRDSSGVLAQFGEAASLELRHGSVMYRRSQRDQQTAITVTVDAFVSDGLWHLLQLSTGDTHTTLSVDNGRAQSHLPEGGMVTINSITLGTQHPNSSTLFTGCIGDLLINIDRLNLASALNSFILSHYSLTYSNVMEGCGGGELCAGVECPDNSVCIPQWLEYYCLCDSQFRLDGTQCVNPCDPNPCQNGGQCNLHHSSSDFQCQCESPFQPPTCEDTAGMACPQGFYSSALATDCSRCVCDPLGVGDDVCDGRNGECSCQANVAVFSPPGDMGCQQCDCDPLGSTSPHCDMASGQCECREGVMGRRCDMCEEDMAGLDEDGCREASMVNGSFSLLVEYTSSLSNPMSPESTRLVSGLDGQLLWELAQFGLPGSLEILLSRISNSSGLAQVHYLLSSYLPRKSGSLSRATVHTLASVMQTIVQSGWVGSYQTQPSSHLLFMDCSKQPCDRNSACFYNSAGSFQCSDCAGSGLAIDGVICRAELPQDCLGGVDVDRDGIPDSCDVCPFTFNPAQSEGDCEGLRGDECEGEVAGGTLWSPTASGHEDTKPCRFPFSGNAVRACLEEGVWGEVDNVQCVSVEGQQLLVQVASLKDGRLLSSEEVLFSSYQLSEFSQGVTLSGGDLHAAGRLLRELIEAEEVLVRSETPHDGVAIVWALATAGSNLLDPRHSSQWVGMSQESEYSTEDLLNSLEQLAYLTSLVLGGSGIVMVDYLTIETASVPPGEFSGQLFNASSPDGTVSTVEIPPGIATNGSSPLWLTSAYLPTMATLLPQRYTFEQLEENVTASGPVFSLTFGGVDTSPLPTPITITFGYNKKPLRDIEADTTLCVFWMYGESGGWSSDGCWVVAVNSTHAVCQCSHLTAFTLLLADVVFEPVPEETPEPYSYTPAEFTYVVIGLVSVLLLITTALLMFLREIQNLHNSVQKNLVASLTLTSIFFIVGIDRTEVEAVCAVFAIVLLFLLFSTPSWLLAEAILVIHSLLQSPLSSREALKFKVYLYLIGWAVPLLLCGISAGVIGILNRSFAEQFGHPHFCWLSTDTVWAFVAPGIILILLDILAFVVALVLTTKTPESGTTTVVALAMSRHKARMSLCISVVLLVMFTTTWVFGLLAIYGNDFSSTVSQSSEYAFAILYATMGVFVFIVMCFNSKVRIACKAQFHYKDEKESFVATTIASSSLQAQLPSTSMRAADVRRHPHHPGYPNALMLLNARQSHISSNFTTPTSTLTHEERKHLPLPPSPGKSPPPEEPKPWFEIPEATPLSPLTYDSDGDVSSSEEREQLEEGDDVSASISEIYRQTRGGGSPESYLEYNQEDPPTPQTNQENHPTPQTKEDPLWYRPRDSISRFEQFEVVPMPYETAIRPPPSPQRSVKWRDLEETDSKPHSSATASPKQSDISNISGRQSEQSPVSSRSRSSHSSPRMGGSSPKITSSSSSGSPQQIPTRTGRTLSDSSAPSPRRHITHSLQRPPPTIPSPGMARTVSDNLPRHYPSPYPHMHRRGSDTSYRGNTSEVSYRSNFSEVAYTGGVFSSGATSRVSTASAGSRTMSLQRGPPSRPNIRHKTSVDSQISSTYHSNGPSIEDSVDQVIRHSDGSETVQSLV